MFKFAPLVGLAYASVDLTKFNDIFDIVQDSVNDVVNTIYGDANDDAVFTLTNENFNSVVEERGD